jgi:hypothetical protein
MAKDKGVKKARRRQRRETEETVELPSRKEREWLKRHLSDQQQSSWRTVYFPEGKYIGYVNDLSQRHGEGFLQGEKGICYEGSWERGVIHGEGVKIFPSGDRYEGRHAAGQRSGWGYYLWTCGDKYTGKWEKNVMHGYGCFVWASTGDVYTGLW